MSKTSLKVVVGGRTYPLTVNHGEETKVTKAAEEINRAIKMLQDNYAVKDMQDLLAMTALQMATKSATSSASVQPADYSAVEKLLSELSNDLD